MTAILLLEIGFLAVLLALSALFSGAETALFSLSPVAREKMRHRHPARGGIIAKLLSHPDRLLVSIVVGNMLVNIFSSTLAERFAADVIPPNMSSLAWVFSTVIMALLILILGEVVPKTLAINRAEEMSLRVAPAILFLDRVVGPLRAVIRWLTDRIVLAVHRRTAGFDTPLTKEELATAIEMGSREGALDGEEKEMIRDIFELGSKTVRQLMTPRNEVVSFELRTRFEEIAEAIRTKEYSRLPVYSEKEDNIVGLLYPKDLVVALSKGEKIAHLGCYLRRPYFVPETMRASRLLKQFLQRKIHIAMVVDEYGAFSGLITLDDLVEEIVGEIRDKGEILPEFEIMDRDGIRLRGRCELEFINDELGLDLFSKESVTLGGFLFEKLGKIPRPGAVYEEDGIYFEVLSMKGNRVGQVMIRKKGIGLTAEKESE